MSNYVLSCCSTADADEAFFTGKNINYICFHFLLDGVEYPDDLGKSMSFDKFYAEMARGADTRTSQVNVDEFVNYFRPFLQEGKDILHLTLSSGISGVYNSAKIAAEDLSEEFPDRKIYIVDSLCASSGFALIMDKLAELRDAGKTIDELRVFAEDNKKKVHHWFFTDTLEYLVRGGRVSKVSGFFGTALKICPLLNVDYEGKLIPREKIRTSKKAKEACAAKMDEYATDRFNYSGKVYISHANNYVGAREVADMIEAKYPNLAEPVSIFPIGTTIGSHTGPGLIALFFWGDERYN